MNLENNNPKLISPLTLAFVGDGVYDLLVRKYLVNHHDLHVGELNKIKVKFVNCKSQAEFAKMLMPVLTEEELSIYKRGRNASPKCTPKHGSVGDYHSATGFEALFGFLYLKGETDRIETLFNKIVESREITE